MRVTSTDVAKRAGVSRATVSYVLNETPGQTISEQTRDAVQAAARELGYRPNAGARSLRSGRSDTVLFPLPGLETTLTYGVLINRIARALREQRLTLVTDFTDYDDPNQRIDAWLRLGPAVLIDIVLRRDDPAHDALRAAGVSVLSVPHTRSKALRPIDVFSDDAREVQMQHLLDAGHRNIVYPIPSLAHKLHGGRGRQKGMYDAVKRAGANLIFEDVELDHDSVTAAVARWRKHRPRLDAVCAYNDEMAIALLSAFAEQGVRVPDDIAVIGVDNDPLSAVITPTLTSVTLAIEELGGAIVEGTAALIAGDALYGEFEIPPLRVVERESA